MMVVCLYCLLLFFFFFCIQATQELTRNKKIKINQLQKQPSTQLIMSSHQSVKHRKHNHTPLAITPHTHRHPTPNPAELTNTPAPTF